MCLQGITELIGLLLSRAQPKRLGAHVVTGPALAALAQAYTAAMNQGAVPSIAGAWQVRCCGAEMSQELTLEWLHGVGSSGGAYPMSAYVLPCMYSQILFHLDFVLWQAFPFLDRNDVY